MTDDFEPTEEDLLREEAKKLVATPPEPIPDAVGLPDDVRDDIIEDTP
jgi:hypothetical protein